MVLVLKIANEGTTQQYRQQHQIIKNRIGESGLLFIKSSRVFKTEIETNDNNRKQYRKQCDMTNAVDVLVN